MPTVTLYPSSFNSAVSSLVRGQNDPVGHGSNYTSNDRCVITTLTAANSETYAFWNFDCSSIPSSHVIINSVTCTARCYVTNTSYITTRGVQLFVGTSTPKGSSVSFNNTSGGQVVTLSTGSSWTRSDLDNLTIRIYGKRGANTSTATIDFWGATLTIDYTIIPTYAISVSSGAGSTGYNVTDGGYAIVEQGQNYTLTFTALTSGHIIRSLTDNNIDVTNNVIAIGNNQFRYTLNFVSTSHNLVVVVGPPPSYIINSVKNGPGTISPSGQTTVTQGDSYTLTMTPTKYNPCVITIEDNGVDRTTRLTTDGQANYYYTLNNIDQSHTLDVLYTNWYNITINKTGAASGTIEFTSIITQSSTATVDEGSTVSMKITPGLSSYGVTCTDNNIDVTSSLVRVNVDSTHCYYTYDITNLSNNHTVVANITQSFNINTSITGKGTISASDTVIGGSNKTIIITPTYFNVSTVTLIDNNTDVSSSLVNHQTYYAYTLNNISADHTLVATITVPSYNITTSVVGSGSITPSFSVSHGDNATIDITPTNISNTSTTLVDNNIDVSSGLVNTGSSYRYTLSTISQSHTIIATISNNLPEVQDWWVKIASGGGTWTPINTPYYKTNNNWKMPQEVYYKYNGNWLLVWRNKLLFAADFTSNLSYISYIDGGTTGVFTVNTGFTPTYDSNGIFFPADSSNFRIGIVIPSALNTFLHTTNQEVWFSMRATVIRDAAGSTSYSSGCDYGWGNNQTYPYYRQDSVHNFFSINGEYYKNRSGEPYVPAGTTVWLKSCYSSNGYFTEYVYSNSTWTGANAYTNPGTWKQHYQNTSSSKAIWNYPNHQTMGLHHGLQDIKVRDFKIWSSEPTNAEIGI